MFVVTPDEIRRIDRRAIDEFGIPGIVLMENAALRVVEVINKYYPLKKRDLVVVLAGGGNNGGDGLAVARHLFFDGVQVEVILLAQPERITGDAKINLEIVRRTGIPVYDALNSDGFQLAEQRLCRASLIVDAIFGTGLSRPVEGIFARIIEAVNDADAPVVAVDIPSGINGDNGHVMGTAVKAEDTVTFGYPKRGNLLYPGREYVGRLHVARISLPSDSAEAIGVKDFTLDKVEAAARIKKRSAAGHKGDFGKVAVIAGSTGMTGAATLTATAALRSGAGIAVLGIPASLNDILENKLTEVMTKPLKDNGTGCLHEDCLDDILDLTENMDVLAIGPGLGRNKAISEILRNIFGRINISIVLDADGLNGISENINLLGQHTQPVVITPHVGEMARLTGLTIAEILDSPVLVAQKFSQEQGIIVLLKGATTVVCEPGGRVYFNTVGNSGMATAGSGDVLTGIIAGLIAQGYDAYEAAVLGAFLHGYAGNLAASLRGEAGMLAGDILEALPAALKELYDLSQKDL
ncbi:MAG: NAD(P)H-hydrate dehydratase [Clostridiales bacterium]|nr:NAD(P)H-hydrate dehydratase [Clostridiales bacterium]